MLLRSISTTLRLLQLLTHSIHQDLTQAMVAVLGMHLQVIVGTVIEVEEVLAIRKVGRTLLSLVVLAIWRQANECRVPPILERSLIVKATKVARESSTRTTLSLAKAQLRK